MFVDKIWMKALASFSAVAMSNPATTMVCQSVFTDLFLLLVHATKQGCISQNQQPKFVCKMPNVLVRCLNWYYHVFIIIINSDSNIVNTFPFCTFQRQFLYVSGCSSKGPIRCYGVLY
jgi:hypothetical protein